VKIEDTDLPGVKIVSLDCFRDGRGCFVPSFDAAWCRENLGATFVQDNLSRSRRGVLRGLHYQYPGWQGKLVSVVRGEIFDVVVDLRPGSPTRGRWKGFVLSAPNHQQLWVPEGFAHGFCVLSDMADVLYKVTAPRNADTEGVLAWNDPSLSIRWPTKTPVLSERDKRGLSVEEVLRSVK
jgi:dTDP-4-dehydrorhamnose 3,5-epimerase